MLLRILIVTFIAAMALFSQVPAIEPGVSHDLAIWRAAHYSDVRYKLNLTLEKMSPVLKGTIEIRVNVRDAGTGGRGDAGTDAEARASARAISGAGNNDIPPIILDWRKIAGHEKDSTLSNISINGIVVEGRSGDAFKLDDNKHYFIEDREHLIFGDGVKSGENVIKLDFTSPILTSGSAITRYVDKEDGAEYIYSLFVPSDASTAFPVFDQPDLKARLTLNLTTPDDWRVISNTSHAEQPLGAPPEFTRTASGKRKYEFAESRPISTYVFAFAVGPWGQFSDLEKEYGMIEKKDAPVETHIYVRTSQYVKAGNHSSEMFRLTRECIKYLETYFDYKFPFPKYDIVLIPEFPFGGMEHAGATFLREDGVIFPQEPTKNDYISRALLIFHETAHQWFGDTVTMLWFDDLWLKEGFAEFMAYKTLEKVMPEANAWKVFYERNKQAAYLTDSTKGTTPIYQEIANLSNAKSAYGNIVYRKAPSFLRQAEFYLGEDKFQTAVRAFLKKHEFANAGWEDLVKEFEIAPGGNPQVFSNDLDSWAQGWVKGPGLTIVRTLTDDSVPGFRGEDTSTKVQLVQYKASQSIPSNGPGMPFTLRFKSLINFEDGSQEIITSRLPQNTSGVTERLRFKSKIKFALSNYGDYGYGIFLLDDKSRDYVLKNIQNEKDPFLRTMMWGSVWDSVREGELDPKEYVELVVRNIATEQDENTIQSLMSRVSTAINYYMSEPPAVAGGLTRPTTASGNPNADDTRPQPPATAGGTDLQTRLEAVLIDRLQNAPTLGLRITFYRAFLNIASTERARGVLKGMLKGGNLSGSEGVSGGLDARGVDRKNTLPTGRVSASNAAIPLRTKDRFDIVTKLLILNDPDAPKLLDDLIKAETSDEAKRYAYAAKAGVATAENKAKFWTDFTTNKDISESWIESSLGAFNATKHADLTLPYLERALAELPNLKRNRKIFFVNGWLAAFIGGQRSEEALAIVNKFLADNPNLDKDLRLKILENVDLIERAVKIRAKYGNR